MPSLIEQEKTIEQKRGELHRLFEEHKKDGEFDLSTDQIGEARTRNDELNALCQAFEQQKSADEIRKRNEAEFIEMKRRGAPPMPQGPHGAPYVSGQGPMTLASVGAGFGGGQNPMGDAAGMVQKSFGQAFVESEAFTGYRGGVGPEIMLDFFNLKEYFDDRKAQKGMLPSPLFGVDRKANPMLTTAGWAPFIQRSPRVVLSATEPPRVTDILPTSQTTSAAIKYMEETTFNNQAAPVAEAAAKPQSELALTERTANIIKIATWIASSKEQLDDVSQVRSYIDNRLTLMLEIKLEDQILNGAGAPGMTGFLNWPGVLSQPKATDAGLDAIFKAMLQVQTTGKANPTAIVVNTIDYGNIRTLRTTDGIYIMGQPTDTGPTRLWGLPLIVTANIAQGTALTGDFSVYSELAMREGITIQMSNGYQDYFVKNLVAILAELRAVLLVYRATAFCKVTGL